jgi:hypothetical protein
MYMQKKFKGHIERDDKIVSDKISRKDFSNKDLQIGKAGLGQGV